MISRRVLIAVDSRVTAEELRTMLARWGHGLAGIAQDGQGTLALAEALAPDLVLLEAKLPGLDGIEAVRLLMACRPVPIVLLATHMDPDLIERAMAAGVMGYLVKPVRCEAVGPAPALARFRDLMALRKEVTGLKDALLLRQQVARAKGILVQRMQLSEAEAHKRLQGLAQRERCTLAVAAGRVITADTFFAMFEHSAMRPAAAGQSAFRTPRVPTAPPGPGSASDA
jgi:response regulator NasT